MDFSWVEFENLNNLIFLDSYNRLNCVDPLFFRLEFLKTTQMELPKITQMELPKSQNGLDFITKETKKSLNETSSNPRVKSSRKLFRFKDKPQYYRHYKNTGVPIQRKCCIEKCEEKSSKRSMNSLKVKYKFKTNYIDDGKLRICNKHYFSDLYEFKKKKKQKKMY